MCCVVRVVYFSLVVSFVSAVNDYGLCCLCDECNVPLRGEALVDVTGKTCYEVEMEMVDPLNFRPNTRQCRALQKKHRQRCCDPDYDPVPVIRAPTPTPEASDGHPKGSEPRCDLCVGGAFPGTPHTITAVLYVKGHPTCEDLYHMGRDGQLPDRICNPLQDWAVEPCGCGKTDTTPKSQRQRSWIV